MATKTVQMPPDLLAAIEGDGVLTDDQIRQLVEIEAEMIGLTFDEAVAAARADALPKNHIGFDIQSLIEMLDAPHRHTHGMTMPFEGRTPREASQRYRDSLNVL